MLDGPLGSGALSDTVDRTASAGAKRAGPVRSLLTVAVLGYLLLAIGLVLVGEVIVHLGLFAGLRHWDDHVSQWFVGGRTSGGAHVTAFWTEVANTEGIVGVGLVVELVLAVRRRWRDLLLVVVGLAVELSVFLTVNEVVRRPRPSVPKLGIEPATFSFPSGHIAATVVLYGSIALLVSLTYRKRLVTLAVWSVVVLLGLWVGFARVYRGMHHVSDVVAGALMGVGCLCVAAIAARASSLAASASPADEELVNQPGPATPDVRPDVPGPANAPPVGVSESAADEPATAAGVKR